MTLQTEPRIAAAVIPLLHAPDLPYGPAYPGTRSDGAAGNDLGRPADHLAFLHSCGLSRDEIAEQADLKSSVLTRASHGQQISRVAMVALRRVRLSWTPPAGHIFALPSRRRLQAMAYIGHTPAALAAALNQPTLLVWEWTTGEHRFLPQPAAAAINRLFRRLSFSPGPSRDIVAYARDQNWVSALAWDGNAIDDPWGRPDTDLRGVDRIVDPIAVHRALAGDRTVVARLTRGERYAAVQLGRSYGLTAKTIAARLNRTPRTIDRDVATGRDRTHPDPFVAYYRFDDLRRAPAA